VIAAFFADDMSASHAALLASSAFDRRADEPALSPGLVAGGDRIVEALPTSLDAARACGRHLMVALPLAHLDDRAIRSRVYVAVVSFGPSPVAASAALRAMAAGALPDLPPPWLLACCGSARPAGLRALPMALTTLGRGVAARVLDGEPGPDVRSHSVGLAAALYLAALFEGAGSAADLRLRTSLLELAADLDDGGGDAARAPAPRPPARRPAARRKPSVPGARRLATAKPHIAPRHAVGCACSALA